MKTSRERERERVRDAESHRHFLNVELCSVLVVLLYPRSVQNLSSLTPIPSRTLRYFRISHSHRPFSQNLLSLSTRFPTYFHDLTRPENVQFESFSVWNPGIFEQIFLVRLGICHFCLLNLMLSIIRYQKTSGGSGFWIIQESLHISL